MPRPRKDKDQKKIVRTFVIERVVSARLDDYKLQGGNLSHAANQGLLLFFASTKEKPGQDTARRD